MSNNALENNELDAVNDADNEAALSDENVGGFGVTTPAPAAAPELPSGMNTGQGADDDPPLSIADKHDGETILDPNGDGVLTVAEADVLLGGKQGTTGESETNRSDAAV